MASKRALVINNGRPANIDDGDTLRVGTSYGVGITQGSGSGSVLGTSSERLVINAGSLGEDLTGTRLEMPNSVGDIQFYGNSAFDGGTGNGGGFIFTGGNSPGGGSQNQGGPFSFTGGQGNGANAGGAISFVAGQGGATGVGGNVTITTGAGGSTSGNSGSITLQGGNVTSGTIGSVMLGRGTTTTSRNGDFVYIPTAAGTPTGTPGASAGRVAMLYDTTNDQMYVYDGAWQTVGGGGGVSEPANQIVYGTGASVDSEADFTWDPATNVLAIVGTIRNSAGTFLAPTYSFSADTNTGMYNPVADILSFTAGGGGWLDLDGNAGGLSTFTAKQSSSGTAGNSILIQAGNNNSTGNGGNLTLNSGGSTTSPGVGGTLSLNAGDSSGTGTGGALTITAGAGGTTGTAGAVTISGGEGGSTSGAGGTVTVQGGSVTSGDVGNVVLGRGSTTTSRNGDMMYIPTSAGTPTGTPASVAGMVPLIFDTTNNVMYVYSGGSWKTDGTTWT